MAVNGKTLSMKIKIRTKNYTCSDIYDSLATTEENYNHSNSESFKKNQQLAISFLCGTYDPYKWMVKPIEKESYNLNWKINLLLLNEIKNSVLCFSATIVAHVFIVLCHFRYVFEKFHFHPLKIRRFFLV